ncbi:MAG TPA: peptidoglycan bridge formation glycyltransferase FemA/FemB family protein [Ktedonosporobacter sp.]|nr:peptidoglycan bridge formation glycyltransferase FemA/FemB family protein [Ktedonosporobacter sp.]
MKTNTRYVLRAVPVEQREQWDSVVSEHANGHLLQSWDWGELKAFAGWHPLRLALWDRESPQIVAAAQVLRRTAPRVPLWAGHLAYIPKGPVIDWSQSALCDVFFAQLDTYLSKQGALALRLEPGPALDTQAGEQARQRLAEQAMHTVQPIQPLRTIVLDLAPDEETLLAQMKEKWRYNVRLSGRKGVTVRVAETAEDVRAWYILLQATGERDQFGIHTCEYYLRAWELFGGHDQLRLFLAEYQGQLLAGIFVSLYAHEAIYMYGASSNELRQLMPNYLLQWEAIRWARQQGAHHYDFWGIPETDAEDEAMSGVYRFKRGWGGRVVQFPGAYERIYRPLSMKIANKFL